MAPPTIPKGAAIFPTNIEPRGKAAITLKAPETGLARPGML
jgi:hypothetical protein